MQSVDEIEQSVVELYIATFNRAPDAAGLAYWVSNITTKDWSISHVARSMFESSEVAQTYPNTLSNSDFLNAVYNNVLGRDGDADGIAYWLNEMNGGRARTEMILTIINGAKAPSGDADDKQVLQNKTEVGTYFAVTKALNDIPTSYSILRAVTKEAKSVVNAKQSTDIYVATSANQSVILGTSAVENITGTAAADYIYVFEGDDTVYGGAGADTIYGGDGADSLYGEAGADIIHGEDGDDYLYGGEGDDYLYGGEGDDYLYGGAGADTIYGGAGDDFIDGGDGANFIDGGEGNDTIYGGADEDLIYGGADDDIIYGGAGDDFIYGGAGNDIIYGGDGDDTLIGNGGNDTIYGGEGDDTIYGESGNDTIHGGAGADTIWGGSGVDTFIFEVGDSTLASMSVIVDFEFNSSVKDKFVFVNQGAEVISSSATSVSTAATLLAAANIAAAGDGSTNAIVKWFYYGEDTYIVQDLSVDATLNATQDIIVKLQGIIDLSGIDTQTITFA